MAKWQSVVTHDKVLLIINWEVKKKEKKSLFKSFMSVRKQAVIGHILHEKLHAHWNVMLSLHCATNIRTFQKSLKVLWLKVKLSLLNDPLLPFIFRVKWYFI